MRHIKKKHPLLHCRSLKKIEIVKNLKTVNHIHGIMSIIDIVYFSVILMR